MRHGSSFSLRKVDQQMVSHQLKLHLCVEHTKRAAKQAGHIWAQMFVPVPNLPSPSEQEWVQTTNGGWEVK